MKNNSVKHKANQMQHENAGIMRYKDNLAWVKVTLMQWSGLKRTEENKTFKTKQETDNTTYNIDFDRQGQKICLILF